MTALPMHNSTSTNTEDTVLYFSELGSDPEMGQLVELFVQELPSRLTTIQRAASDHDWQDVGRFAHQLKGAGGSHGFPELASAAASVERAARGGGLEAEVTAALKRLAFTCAQTRAGTPCRPGGRS
jgi:histidine phosphotransfer protein HptB